MKRVGEKKLFEGRRLISCFSYRASSHANQQTTAAQQITRNLRTSEGELRGR